MRKSNSWTSGQPFGPVVELTAVQRAGNRFGVVSVAFALLAGLGAAFDELTQLAWALAPFSIVLGVAGLQYCLTSRATNRADVLIGLAIAVAVMCVLVVQVSVAYPLPVSGGSVMPGPIVPVST